MSKIDLPDGWYRLPGDGEYGSPDARKNKYGGSSTTRYIYWAKVVNGKIVQLPGLDTIQMDAATTNVVLLTLEAAAKAEAIWGITLPELLKSHIDVYQATLSPTSNLGKVAAITGLIGLGIGFLKHRQTQVKKVLSKKQLATQDQNEDHH